MSAFDFVTSREDAFDFLDEYAINKKDEVDRRQIGLNTGLIKTYLIETETKYTSNIDTIKRIFGGDFWKFNQLDEKMAIVSIRNQDFGFIEIVSSRHLYIHTIFPSDESDGEVSDVIKDNTFVDHAWFSGYFLNQIWEVVIRGQMKNRIVKFRFEHKNVFDQAIWQEDDEPSDLLDDNKDYDEATGSQIVYSNVVSKIDATWDTLQEKLPDFYAMKMLKLPSTELRGGYDIWDWGKVTHRTSGFRDARAHLRWVIGAYQLATEIIEKRTWLQTEKIKMRDGTETHTLSGSPVTFVFPEKLSERVFQNFIEQVFYKKNKYFRLWGNPLRINDNKYHVYGIDMHLWQRIYLELTPERFIVILPKGTCGNTIHRLANNIQRYVSPDVNIFIGGERYEDLITQILLGNYTNG